MPNRIEMFRRLERQYFRDRLGTLGLQQLDGMILHLLGREGHMRQEDLAVQLAVDKGAVARSLARPFRTKKSITSAMASRNSAGDWQHSTYPKV